MNREEIEQEVEKTLSLLDSVQRAQANPFFWTRLEARLNAATTGTHRGFVFEHMRMSLAFAGLAVLLLLNVYSLWQSASRSQEVKKDLQLTSCVSEFDLANDRY